MLRLHGVLFSNYFEYGVLLISAVFAVKSLLSRNWSFKDGQIRSGILIGVGATLFLDVILVDELLRLHAVNYPASLNFGTGLTGLVLAVAGIFSWLAREG